MTNLDSKIAIVTGGTKGIGYAIAEALLKKGASVYICGRQEQDLKSAIERLSVNGSVNGSVCDVRDVDKQHEAAARPVERAVRAGVQARVRRQTQPVPLVRERP